MDFTEITLKNICCTCLSVDRKLKQLSRVDDGVNKLFFLLSYDSVAYEAMFHKDTVNLHICWECRAVMARLCRFTDQACIAQKQLTDIMDGKINLKTKIISLSRLTNHLQNSYNNEYIRDDETIDNFIDCGPDVDFLKTESDDDIPLSKLTIKESEIKTKLKDINDITIDNELSKEKIDNTNTKKRKKLKTKVTDGVYSIIKMSEEEMNKSIEKRRILGSYVDIPSKCESCVEGFENCDELEKHNSKFHVEKLKHLQCDICLSYIKEKSYFNHRKEHYNKYTCTACGSVLFTLKDLSIHLKLLHSIDFVWKKTRTIPSDDNSKQKRNKKGDDKTPLGYMCAECNKYFENKNQRYKHVQRCHREGHKCATCGKTFAFRFTLSRHEMSHRSDLPRSPCPTCGKLIRCDLRLTHARTHAPRQTHDCRVCDKRFVSRTSYVNHLKYSRRHTVMDVLKYKCTSCTKGYRSRAELLDHVNYQHKGETRHKCHICDKALATPRGITRHVKRVHQGVKENVRDKICQICGKAFKDSKVLSEHERTHTGERPLRCALCARAFRQRAALHAHARRVHGRRGAARPGATDAVAAY